VATPVWFVEDGRRLLVETEVAHVERLMARKYRGDLLFIKPFRSAQRALHRNRPRETPVILELTPS
jgi:hypothetical protein